MSIRRLYYVVCEGCETPAQPGIRQAEARTIAKAEGFERRDGRDLCSRCVGLVDQGGPGHLRGMGAAVSWEKPRVTCPNCQRKVAADRMWGIYMDDEMRRPVRHRRQLVTGQLGDWCEPRRAWRVGAEPFGAGRTNVPA